MQSVGKVIIVVELIRLPGVVCCCADWISDLALSHVAAKLEHATICFGTGRLCRICLLMQSLLENVDFNLGVICFSWLLLCFKEIAVKVSTQ